MRSPRCRSPLLQAGDIYCCGPVSGRAVDGSVVEGQSKIDQSLITGETLPVKADPGSAVYAGTLNLSGALRVRVSAASEGTLLAEIAPAARQCRAGALSIRAVGGPGLAALCACRPRYGCSDHVRLGAFGASWHDAIVTAIAVLIITCPCALGLAIPAMQTVVSGAMFRTGVLLNSGDAIERLADVDRVVFDKTGTLTLPELDVANAASIPPGRVRAGRPACTCQPSSGCRRRGPRGQAKTPLAGSKKCPVRACRGSSTVSRSDWAGRHFATRTISPTISCAGIPKPRSSPSVMAKPVTSLRYGSGCARMRQGYRSTRGDVASKSRSCPAIANRRCVTPPSRWKFTNGVRA